MRKVLLAALAMGVASSAWADQAGPDSAAVHQLSEVTVAALKAAPTAPFAVSHIQKSDLTAFARDGRELPFLFARTPGVMGWGENGLGTGTAYLRIRGAADSRINVTLDGVSLNSPEDQCVFWANTNSYAALLQNVQIQRGVGTSSNGDGAFGGTVAMQTVAPTYRPSLEVTASGGSYNTWVFGGNFSTGLTGLKLRRGALVLDGAYHETRTDGYIHGTDGRSGSYYGALTYINDRGTLKLSYKNIGNFEKTGQAWNGIDTGDLLDWNYGGMGTGIFNYKDMYRAGLGRYNTLVESLVDGGDPTKGTYRYKMADGSTWRRTTDNFWQNRSLLNLTWRIDDRWSTSATLHYTRGYGYYAEFKPDCKLSKFGLTFPDLKKTDFVRRKGLDQNAYGLVWTANYHDSHWDAAMGLTLQDFLCNHFGHLTYIANPDLAKATLTNGRYTYYDSDGEKYDRAVFLKGTYHITDRWSAFGDLQYRYVRFLTDGINDKWDEGGQQTLDIDKRYHFLNPKAGLSYRHAGHSAYLSYALAHREPERNNFTDNGNYPAPKAEMLHDVEAGYGYTAQRWHASAGLYAMMYHNQFVQTGAQSDIGEALTTNIKRSYRLGLELAAGVDVASWLSLEANAALSINKVKDFDEVVEDWDNGSQTIHYSNSTLAFSPAALVNGFADFHYKGLSATWHTNFVSRQYLDNTQCRRRSLPKYSQTDIRLAYDLPCWTRGLKHTVFALSLNNIFNAHYAPMGWVYSAIYASGGNPNSNRYTEIGYTPMAGFNVMGSVTLKL